jgi:hypothetical protein
MSTNFIIFLWAIKKSDTNQTSVSMSINFLLGKKSKIKS